MPQDAPAMRHNLLNT